MLIGYARVSTSDKSQKIDSQIKSLTDAGVLHDNIYTDFASGAKEDRPKLKKCLSVLREGDTLVVFKLDRLGRNLKHLLDIVDVLDRDKVNLKIVNAFGSTLDTNTSMGRLIFTVFGAMAEFERALIIERTKAGLEAARARGRKGGRPLKVTPAMVKTMQDEIINKNTLPSTLCKQFDISPTTFYRYLSQYGELRYEGKKIMIDKQIKKITD